MSPFCANKKNVSIGEPLEPTIKTFQLPSKALGGGTFVGLTSFVDTYAMLLYFTKVLTE